MPFTENQRQGGREKGSLNKIGKAQKEKIAKILDAFSTEYWIEQIELIESPNERLKLLSSLTEFLTGKIARTEITGEDGKELFKPTIQVLSIEGQNQLNKMLNIEGQTISSKPIENNGSI